MNKQEQVIVQNQELVIDLFADYYKFFRFFWPELSPEQIIINWHIKVMARKLQELSEYIIKREIPPYADYFFNVPPGSTKSSLVSQAWPIWCWLQDPSLIWIVDSYAYDASLNHSFKAKQIIKSDMFQTLIQPYFERLHGKRIELVRDLGDDWINNFGGRYYSTSTTGTVTSMHAHCIIFDDPMNAVIADSDTKRDASNRALSLTFPSRKIDKRHTPSVYVMQRFHEDDTIGYFIKRSKTYYHLCLPAELTDRVIPPEMKEKYTDGLLDPVRLPRDVLIKAKSELGSFGYAGQYLQDPAPVGGGKIKKQWIPLAHPNTINEVISWQIYIDGAYTANTDNDPTGIIITGVWEQKMIIRFATSKFLELPELIREIAGIITANRLPKSIPIYIEPKASGKSLKQMLVKAGYNAIEINSWLVAEGKTGRINLTAPYAEAGRIEMVEAPWNEEFIYQLATFPKASHDEYVDLTGYAVDKLLYNIDLSNKVVIDPSMFY